MFIFATNVVWVSAIIQQKLIKRVKFHFLVFNIGKALSYFLAKLFFFLRQKLPHSITMHNDLNKQSPETYSISLNTIFWILATSFNVKYVFWTNTTKRQNLKGIFVEIFKNNFSFSLLICYERTVLLFL